MAGNLGHRLTKSRLWLIGDRVHLRNLSHQPASTPAFCFDIDGVLIQGSNVLEQGRRALAILSGDNKWNRQFPFLLLTNGGGSHERDRAIKLTRQLGVEITPKNLVQSHTPFQSAAKDYQDKPVLVIGGENDICRDIARQYGFKKAYAPSDIMRWRRSIWPFGHVPPTSNGAEDVPDFSTVSFAAVFVFHDSRDWGRDAQILVDLASSSNGVINKGRSDNDKDSEAQLPVHFSNPDLIWKGSYERPRLGQGAFQAACRAVYYDVTKHHLEAFTHGKPSLSTFNYAKKMLVDMSPRPINQFYMFGDNPASDIQGANTIGWQSILVKTGVYQQGTTPEHTPTVVCDDVLQGVLWALEQEGY